MTLELELEIEEPAEGEGGPASEPTQRSSLTIGQATLQYVDRAGRRVVLDLDRRRRLTVDEKTRTFVDDSLFAEVGLRSVELPNRAYIRKVLEAGGADGSLFAPVMVEHQLALTGEGSTTTIDHERPIADGPSPGGLRAFFRRKAPSRSAAADIVMELSADEIVYRAGAQRLLAHARDGLDAPSRGLAQFLRYRWGGHPLVLAEISKLPFVPRQLRLHALQPGAFDRGPVTVRARAARPSDGEWHTPTDLREVATFEAEDPADAILMNARPAVTAPHRASEERLAEVQSLIRGGDGLRGALGFFELTLEEAVPMPPEIAAALRTTSDERVRALLSTMSREHAEPAARRALAVHSRLRETITGGSAVLDVFEAEVRMSVGEAKEAKALLVRAVTANRRLTGAYKTLGDLYLAAFDAKRAWRCWDIARALFPSHPILAQVSRFEQTLLTRYPEYFQGDETRTAPDA
jgi:hypothetical protein